MLVLVGANGGERWGNWWTRKEHWGSSAYGVLLWTSFFLFGSVLLLVSSGFIISFLAKTSVITSFISFPFLRFIFLFHFIHIVLPYFFVICNLPSLVNSLIFLCELIDMSMRVLSFSGNRHTGKYHVKPSCHIYFERIFFRSGFNVTSNKAHLKAAFVVLSSRIKISKKSQPGFQELLWYTYFDISLTYLCCCSFFRSFIPFDNSLIHSFFQFNHSIHLLTFDVLVPPSLRSVGRSVCRSVVLSFDLSFVRSYHVSLVCVFSYWFFKVIVFKDSQSCYPIVAVHWLSSHFLLSVKLFDTSSNSLTLSLRLVQR